MTNRVTNPSFEVGGVRSFEGWDVVGCFSLVVPPKESAAKMGPPSHGGECSVGAVSTLTQTITLEPDFPPLSFSYRRTIVRGQNPNQIKITLSAGEWVWTVSETLAMSFEGTLFSQVWLPEVPPGTEQVTLEIEGTYNTGIGLKVTEITLE